LKRFRIFKWISDFPIPAQTGIFGLVGKQAMEELKKLTEKIDFPGLRSWVGGLNKASFTMTDRSGLEAAQAVF
jgi:hypothetical protein